MSVNKNANELAMTTSLSMPNLPGMVVNTSTWIHRQQDSFGFGRREQLSRPNSAVVTTLQKSPSVYQITRLSGQPTSYIARPATADGSDFKNFTVEFDRSNNNFDNSRSLLFETNKLSRPSTAGPGVPRSSINASSIVPKYVELDKKVCRFYAHFNQDRTWEKDNPLGDPMVETTMGRRVTIHYYLLDNTVEINEPKQTNNGMWNGSFYKKGKLDKSDGTPLQLTDLLVGGTANFLGRTFYITDADQFTRDHFREEFGIELAPASQRPPIVRKDIGAQYATGLGPVTTKAAKTHFGTRSTDYLTTKEIMLASNQFMKYDGRVIRFQCVEVKGPYPPFFPALAEHYDQLVIPTSAKRFALSYYLTDNKIELVVQKTGTKADASHGEPSLILKKSKLPRNWREAQNNGTNPVFYEPVDFNCGEVIDVYGRYFLLVNCDKFTKNSYEEMNIVQNFIPIIPEPVQPIVHTIPQLGDGFLPVGSEEDTLNTVYGQPKIKKDLMKINRNQHRHIRCRAVMLSESDIDRSRNFMITYFMEDDTIQVHEETKRNSGFWGGNFLKRGKYLNSTTESPGMKARYFQPSDIFLGNVVNFNGFQLQIVEMDNLSLRFCESLPDEFPLNDTFKIIGKLMDKTVQMSLNIRPIFIAKDPLKLGYIDQASFIAVLDQVGLSEGLVDQELLTVIRRFKDGNQYFYPELCDLVSHVFYDNYIAPKPHSTPKRNNALPAIDYNTLLKVARSRTTQWRRTLRKEPHTLEGCCTVAVLAQIFFKNGLKISDELGEELYAKYKVENARANLILKELSVHNATSEAYPGHHEKFERTGAGHIAKLRGIRINPLGKLQNPAIKKGLSTNQKNKSKLPSNFKQSILRDRSLNGDYSSSNGYELSEIPSANKLINYNKLCDDIYICDWA
eukprot:gene8512-11507_t